MKSLLHRHARRLPLIVWLIVLVALSTVVAACAPDATGEIVSPNLGAQLLAKEQSGQLEAVPTAAPLTIATMSPEEVVAGLDAGFAAALAAADPAKGENIALQYGCIGCHSMDPAVQLTGPTWHNLGDTAANRRPGESPGLYLYESITNPNAFVVPNFPAGVMPQNYADSIPAEDLATLVAYLLSQHQ